MSELPAGARNRRKDNGNGKENGNRENTKKPTSPEISIYHDPHYFSYQYCTVQIQELGQAILKLIRIIKKQGPGRFGEHGMFHRIFTV